MPISENYISFKALTATQEPSSPPSWSCQKSILGSTPTLEFPNFFNLMWRAKNSTTFNTNIISTLVTNNLHHSLPDFCNINTVEKTEKFR